MSIYVYLFVWYELIEETGRYTKFITFDTLERVLVSRQKFKLLVEI